MNFFNANQKLNNAKKTFIAVLGLAMLIVVLFSAIFITLETFHHCEDEDCPICAMIHMCENNLHQLGDGRAMLFATSIILFLIAAKIVVSDCFYQFATPVSNRVRMNN